MADLRVVVGSLGTRDGAAARGAVVTHTALLGGHHGDVRVAAAVRQHGGAIWQVARQHVLPQPIIGAR